MKFTRKIGLVTTLLVCLFLLSSSHIQTLPPNSSNPTSSLDNSLGDFNPPLQASASITNQTYYFWNGTSPLISNPWSGYENYTLTSSNTYHVSENFDGVPYTRDINDQSRVLSNDTSVFWGSGTHEPFWIFTNVSLGDTVSVAKCNYLSDGNLDFSLNVSAQVTITHLGQKYTCWKLEDTSSGTIAYYEINSGLLINGTFWFNYMGLLWVSYTFQMVATNAAMGVGINIISPSAPIYYDSQIPITVDNYTLVDTVWYRNSTDGGLSWSTNATLSFNGTYHTNSTPLIWADGNYILQVFANDSSNHLTLRTHSFQVLAVGPNIQILDPSQSLYFYQTFDIIIQNLTYADSVWYRYDNGTGWNGNFTLAYNGSLFKDDSIVWNDATYQLQVFANDSLGLIAQRDHMFSVTSIPPLNLSANQRTDETPRIAIDSNNHVHIFWIRNLTTTYDVMYSSNINGYFEPARSIYSSSMLLHSPCIAIDRFDVIHLSWGEYAGLNYNVYYTNNSAGAFGPPVTIPGGDLYMYTSLAVDSLGFAHIAVVSVSMATMNYSIGYTNNVAGNFFVPTSIKQHNLSYQFAMLNIAVDSSSNAHVFWIDNTLGTFQLFYKNNTGGDFSGPICQITANSSNNFVPDVEIDSNDVIHLTWDTLNYIAYDVMYVNITGNVISNPINISSNPLNHDLYPRISIDKATTPDTVYIAWAGVSGSQLKPFLSDNREGDFSAARVIPDASFNTSQLDLVVCPYEGRTYLAWSGDDGNDLEIFFDEDYSPIALISPTNRTYPSQYIPVNVLNSSSHLTQVWCRNRTSSGSWSSNYTLSWDGTFFTNSTNVFFPFNSSTIIQVFSSDSMGRTFSLTRYLSYDGVAPSGYQWFNTTASNIQTSSPIWINGSAWDPAPGSGISSVTITSSNTTGGLSDWSNNIGTSDNFAFYNTSPIVDNHLGEVYEIQVSILDGAGNTFILSCNITLDLQSPYGSQDPLTDLSHPQRGDANSYVWVNGTAFDNGFGVANVTTQTSNHTGWSANQGSLNAWAFYNTTPFIPDGIYEVQVNVTDHAHKSTLVPCYIWVDTVAPSANQWANTSASAIQKTPTIWINGSYSDLFPSSGIQPIIILQSNTSNDVADWSPDVGGSGYFAFYNTSPLLDNQLGGCYEVNLSVIDNAGNYRNLTCKVIVEISAPSGSQDPLTDLSHPQRGDANSYIWVNGTASDDGFGLANVTIQLSNHTGWSSNQGTLNAWSFYNTTPISPDGIYELQINVTDLANNSIIIPCYISVDTASPTGSQWANTTSANIQDSIPIWINGSYADPSPSSGILAIVIMQSNTSGGIFDWSSNVGGAGSFAFYNTSPLPDNQLGGCYEVNLSIIDNAGNLLFLTCRVTVEINPPNGAQHPATSLANPQTGQVIWVNGTAFDDGFGLKNVTIQSSNHTGWSVNQGTLNAWAFSNSTPISGGLWEIIINVTDHTDKSVLIPCYIYVDLLPPTGTQSASTNLSSPQNAEPTGCVWVNGTATDGLGVGLRNVTIAFTNTSASWSLNMGTNESWAFTNTSALSDGLYEITVTLTDRLGLSANITCYIQVDTTPPSGLQDVLNELFQTIDQNGYIWINGTATDGAGSGLLEVIIQGTNTSATWSPNQNTMLYWGFHNTSVLADGVYQIDIRVTDRANHSTIITGYIRVDTSAPIGAQDSATLQPQNANDGWVWVNGTASDNLGIGLLNVGVVATTHPGAPWSANLGTNLSWSFNNLSAISDGNWEVTVNLIDQLGNSRNITCYVTVDTTPPQASQDSVTSNPQTTDLTGSLWLNGTATDGLGLGLLGVTIFNTNSSASWSNNIGTNASWAFTNLTAVGEGIWSFTITLVDLIGNARNITCMIFVDTTAPTGSQDIGTNSSVLQEAAQIWVNGTANDGSGSGVLSISIITGVGTATNAWSANQGTNTSWAFTNTSAIANDQIYWIMVNISDFAGNSHFLNCSFRVELHPPQGSQDTTTQTPQNGTSTGFIWINGTAFDGGSGVKNVSVSNTNITGGASFSANLGTPTSWGFHNTSAIPDGVWALTITIFDNADHATNITGLLIVDTIAPTQPNATYSTPASDQVLLSWSAVIDNTIVTYYIYRNGTPIGNTTSLSYLDSGLSPATYLYRITPVDAAGNVGPTSTTVTVTITGGGVSSDNWWWILIIIFGVVGVSVSTIAVRRQRKSRSPRPSREVAVVAQPPADKSDVAAKIKLEDALKKKAEGPPKKTGLGFFMIEDEKFPEEPEIMMEEEPEPSIQPSAPPQKPAIAEEAKPQPKVVHFTFYCPKCNKWYGLKQFAEVDCPICQQPLKLAYTCPTCKKKFMVKEPGIHKCPTDGSQLIP